MFPLKVKNLSYSYPGTKRKIFDGINFQINSRDFVGIVGANGSGKSTLLKLILDLIEPQEGSITFGDKKIGAVREKVGYLSQFEDIDFDFPMQTYGIVLSGNLGKGIIHKYSKSEHKAAEVIMRELKIWHLKDESIADVSGGQKQKVFLARALVNNPELLILDEPLTSLDTSSQEDFYATLRELNKKMTIIVVDHNLEMLIHYVNKVICIDKCERESIKLHEGNLDNLIHI